MAYFHSLSVKFVALLYFVNLWLAVSWTPSLTGSAGLLWIKSEEAVAEFHGRGQRAQFRLLASTPLSSLAQQTAVDRHYDHIHHKAKTSPRPARPRGWDHGTRMQFGQENFWRVLNVSICVFSAHLRLDMRHWQLIRSKLGFYFSSGITLDIDVFFLLHTSYWSVEDKTYKTVERNPS